MSQTTGVLRELRHGGRLIDLVVLALPIVVLIGVFKAPPATKASLTFSHAAPSMTTALTTHYVHYARGHLIANLVVYLMVVPLVYGFTVLAGRRQLFFGIFWTFILVFPLVLSGSSLILIRRGELFGFSGVALGFAGLLPVAMTRFIGKRYPGPVNLDTAPGLFFFGLSLISYLTVPASSFQLLLVIVPGYLGTAYLLSPLRRLLRSRRGTFIVDTDRVGVIESVFFSVIAYFVILVISFRSVRLGNSAVVNLYLHFLGFSIGFLASYITLRIDRETEQ